MTAKPEPFNVDRLISLEDGVQREALTAFLKGFASSTDPRQRNEVIRFSYRAGWRVLPEILADDSPNFFKPIKRYVFAASCRALFSATHPNVKADPVSATDIPRFAIVGNAAVAEIVGNAIVNVANTASTGNSANNNPFTVASAAGCAEAAVAVAKAVKQKESLRQPLLLAMREDLVALHTTQTLAGRKLWPKEAASLLDVNRWFGTFRKNLERFARGSEIPQIYEALLSGRIEQVIDTYSTDLFEKLFESAKSDYNEWNRGHTTDHKDSPKEPVDESTAKELKKAPRDTLHSEVPLGTDHLDRDSLAGVLFTWLDKNQSHAAIGLFGDWGVGKSTFVNLLRKRLGIPLDVEAADDEQPLPDHYKTADYIGGEFNAWQYEHTDNIQAGLAQELIAALQANLSWWEKTRLTCQFACKYHRVNLIIAAFFAIGAISIICLLQGALWFSGLVGIGGLAAVWRYVTKAVAHPMAKELRTYLRLPSFGKELGTIPVMREQVKAMVTLRLDFFEQKQRLLFVVDDLDRCSPDAVVKVLEAVRLVMDLPNVVVLIAIDQKIALASLALRYKELAIHYGADPKSIARQYLGKVIHVPITLDNPAPEAVENYLRQKLWATDDVSGNATEIRREDESEASDSSKPVKTTEDQPSPGVPKNLKMPTEPAPAKSSDSKDMEAQNMIESIGLSQGQKDAFIKWANKLGLANPRHIKRLDNAYNLIRMRYPDEDEAGEPYCRLVMLMWLEYSRELLLDTYTAFRSYVSSEMTGEPVDRVKPLREKLDNCNKQVGLYWDEVKAVWQDNTDNKSPEDIRVAIRAAYLQVHIFVLPAIEKNNFKSRIS